MRSLICLSFLAAAALGACSQSLTGNMSGTGGSGTGAGGTGGIVAGKGGAGGVDLASFCGNIATEYQAAIAGAQTCDLGKSGQCAKLVDSALSTCGSCPTYVNDPSMPVAIQQAWLAAGCDKLPPVPCAKQLCTVPVTGVCTAVADGGRGSCIPGRSGTGGSSPDAGPSPSTCDALAQKYATVLSVVMSCTQGAAEQCSYSVPQTLSVCPGCTAYVNDESELSAIRQAWDAAGCGNVEVACPAIACIPSARGLCTSTDGGGATCTPLYNAL